MNETGKVNKGQELAKNAAIITFGKFCTQFIGFLLLPLYTSLLSTSEYGTVDLLLTYQQLIGYAAFLQIEQAVFRFLIEVRGEKRGETQVVSTCLAFALFQAVLLGGIAAAAYSFSGYRYLPHLYGCILATILSGMMLQIARGMGDNGSYAVGSFISALFNIGFNILFLVVLRWDIQGMLLAYVLGNLACALFISLRLRVYSYVSFSAMSRTRLMDCLRYSAPMVPNVLAWWVIGASDRTIVAIFLGTAYNGLLTVAHKFPTAYTAIYNMFNLSWTESAAVHIDDDDAPAFFSDVIDKTYRLFSSMAIGIIACMPFLFGILVDEAYAGAYGQIPIYMAASLCQVFQGEYSAIYIAKKRTKELAASTVAAAVLNVVIHVALISSIGTYAAPVSTLAAFLVICVWRYWDVKKYIQVPVGKLSLISSVLVLLLVCAAYYSRDTVACLLALALAIGYALWADRQLLKLALKGPAALKKALYSRK